MTLLLPNHLLLYPVTKWLDVQPLDTQSWLCISLVRQEIAVEVFRPMRDLQRLGH